ncbi:MAG: acyl carrier protein, partial [Marivirga sp.]|nr:acyl carrier protein [Marivirga sp.]
AHELITPDAKFVEDLGADSLDVAELVVEFEKEFAISISDDEAEEFKTVREAEHYLKNKLRISDRS